MAKYYTLLEFQQEEIPRPNAIKNNIDSKLATEMYQPFI